MGKIYLKSLVRLVREQFDRRDPFAVAHPQRIKRITLNKKLTEMAEAAGIRTRTPLEGGQKRRRKRRVVGSYHLFVLMSTALLVFYYYALLLCRVVIYCARSHGPQPCQYITIPFFLLWQIHCSDLRRCSRKQVH